MATKKDQNPDKKTTKASARPKRRQKTTAAVVATAENRRKALQLRLAGLTFEEISDTMGLGNRGAAYALVRDSLEETRREIREDADRYVAEEVTRIERLIRAIWTKAIGNPGTGTDPDLKAIDRMEKLMARKAKLLGLDAPVRAELSGPGGAPIEVSDATDRLVDRLVAIRNARDPKAAKGT
jgi:hypothetical protein